MDTKPNNLTIKSASQSQNHDTYFEWLKKQFPNEIEKLTKAGFLEKLSELRRNNKQ